ncbi:MAG: DUF1800 domain-containing protein, partial [Betaproteobacteria bacterium]|nr:DUF1800 domain-containing protein [Betaproteobacteria bacterium]
MTPSPARSVLTLATNVLVAALLVSCGVETRTTSDVVHPTVEQSARLLTQATFGPTPEEIVRLQNIGISVWFNEQFAKPQTLHLAHMNDSMASLPAGQRLTENHFLESFWRQAVQGDDQLRQRVTYALSQIFVISFQNDILATMPRGVAYYYDTLGALAFGNFRDLLEAVTRNPLMGVYLSSLRNEKTVGARVPDENFAREIMQLFTIGLRQLNADGTDTTSPATPTYTNDDIRGLAKVFTGWSWAGPDTSRGRFVGSSKHSP